jgi:6-pyruvoyltetrahydropterin/6-carboxytetrahydropterin synthase
MPRCTVTRRLHFNAAHRLHNPALSDAENVAIFGPCNSPNYHGHNYDLDVSVEGEIDERTGYVFDLGKLRDAVEAHVVQVLDHKNLNLDVPAFATRIPSAEHIAVWCWDTIAPLVEPARLTRIRLWETPRNYVDYYGDK